MADVLLENRIALVSGAGRGIGKAVCKKLAEQGAIVLAGIRSEGKLDDTAGVVAGGGSIVPVMLDVCDMSSIKQCAVRIKKEYGKLDILVNNAGLTIIERFDLMRSGSLKLIYDTNVFGLINVTQTMIRLLKKSGCPSIINMASIMADDSDIGQTAYGSSKAAVVNMTKTWAKEYAGFGIRVNSIAPGNVDTDMFNIIDGEALEKAIDKIGMKRLAKPEEIANVALFLASDMASYVTGENICVNGGLLL